MVAATLARACPDCGKALAAEKGKMNLRVELCASEHGAFVDRDSIVGMLDEAVLERLSGMDVRDGAAPADCARCTNAMRGIDLDGLPGHHCPECGSLWFHQRDLVRFNQAWKERTYGSDSFAGRMDVVGEGQKLYAAEIIVGALTELDLSVDE